MKIKVIVDNNSAIDQYYLAEPAFCLWIENQQDTLLFDTGYSDIFLKNIKNMSLSLNHVNKIVLSHGHNDHTGGLRYLDICVDLFAHPNVFEEKIFQNISVGSFLTEEKLSEQITFHPLKEVTEISPSLYFLGEIPRTYDFEEGRLENDDLWDDTALVYKTENGLILLSGCAHSGICNITRYAKEVFRQEVLSVIGGFHLLNNKKKAKQTAMELKNLNVQKVYPAHCTDLDAKIILSQYLNIEEVFVNKEFIY